MHIGPIFPAINFDTRSTALTHLEVAKRTGCVAMPFFDDITMSCHTMAGLEEIHHLQKLLAIERISFNEQLGQAVSVSLTTCSWFSFSFVCHFNYQDHLNPGGFSYCPGPLGGLGAPTQGHRSPT